jgi:ferredoxin-type protein NapF
MFASARAAPAFSAGEGGSPLNLDQIAGRKVDFKYESFACRDGRPQQQDLLQRTRTMSGISRRQFLIGRLAGSREPADPFRPRTAVIAAACLAFNRVECRICGESCAPGAIRFRTGAGGVSIPQVDLAACTGCGDCVPACPVAAIALAAVA